MASLENSLKTVVRVFRRECHRVLESEMTTIRGADNMLIALQLVMAEANKTVASVNAYFYHTIPAIDCAFPVNVFRVHVNGMA